MIYLLAQGLFTKWNMILYSVTVIFYCNKNHNPSFNYHESLSAYIIGLLTFFLNFRHFHSILAPFPRFLHHICTFKSF